MQVFSDNYTCKNTKTTLKNSHVYFINFVNTMRRVNTFLLNIVAPTVWCGQVHYLSCPHELHFMINLLLHLGFACEHAHQSLEVVLFHPVLL